MPDTSRSSQGAREAHCGASQRPKLPGTDQQFCSKLFGPEVTRTNDLEALVLRLGARGCQTAASKASLKEVLGDEAALSKSV